MNSELKAYLDKLRAETRALYAEFDRQFPLRAALPAKPSAGAPPPPLTRSAVVASDGDPLIDSPVVAVVPDGYCFTAKAQEILEVAPDAPPTCTEMAPITCSTKCSTQVDAVASADEVQDGATTVHPMPAANLNHKEVAQTIPQDLKEFREEFRGSIKEAVAEAFGNSKPALEHATTPAASQLLSTDAPASPTTIVDVVPVLAALDASAKTLDIYATGVVPPTPTTCSTECPSRALTATTSVFTLGTTPTSATATIDVTPVLAASVVTNDFTTPSRMLQAAAPALIHELRVLRPAPWPSFQCHSRAADTTKLLSWLWYMWRMGPVQKDSCPQSEIKALVSHMSMDPTEGNKVRPIPWPSFACLISMVPRDSPVLSQPMMQVMGDVNLGLEEWRLAICSMAAHLFQSMQQMGALSTGCSNNIFLQFMQIGPYELDYAAVVYLLEDYLRPVNLEPRREWPPLVKANFSELCSFRQFDSDSTLCLFPWNPGDSLLRITTGFLTASSGSQWHVMLKNCGVLVQFRILHIFLVPSIKLQPWPSCRYTFTHFEQQFFSQLPFPRTDKMPETRRLMNISVQWQFLHQEEFSGSGHCDTEGNYEPDGLYMVADSYDTVHLVLYPCQPSHTDIVVYVVMTMVPHRIKIFYGLYSFSDSPARELPEIDVYRAILCELMLVLDQHLDISNSQLDDSNSCFSLLWLSSDYLPNCAIDVIGSNRGIYLLDISWDPGGLAWPLLLELARRVVFEGGKCVLILTAAYLVHASYISFRPFTPSSIVVQWQWDTHPSQEKNSQHISMLPCFISKPISCEGNHGWYLGILSLFMIQPVQFAAELHSPDSSLFASVALLFGHKQRIQWTPNTAKFSVFHQQLLEVFQNAYSTPSRFSVCPIRRSCCLVLLPMLDVYNVVCYELRLAVGIQLGTNELLQERISENSGSFARRPPDRVTKIAEHAKRGSELIHAVHINYKGVQSYSYYMVQQREGIGLAPNFRTMKLQIPSTEVSETRECQHFISTTAYHQMWDYFEVGSNPTYPKPNEDGSVQHRVIPTYTCWWRSVQVCVQCPMLIWQMVNGIWEQANSKVYLLLHWKLKDASWHRGTNIQPGTLLVCGDMPCECTPFLDGQLNISKSRPDDYNSKLPALQWTQGHFQGGRSVLPVTVVFAQGFVGHEYYLSFDCDYDDNGYIFDWISIDHNNFYLVQVYSNFDYHRDSNHIHEHRMHWDPGGCQWCRLGVKPNFKKGGMLGPLPN